MKRSLSSIQKDYSSRHSPYKSPNNEDKNKKKNDKQIINQLPSKNKTNNNLSFYDMETNIQLALFKRNREKLDELLQLSNLLLEKGLPPRCGIHSNTLTLYCFNQKKLLCINCIYENGEANKNTKSNNNLLNKHKTHKVLSIKDGLPDINKQSNKFHELLEKDLRNLNNQDQILDKNQTYLKFLLSSALNKLKTFQQDISQMLKKKFIQVKSVINNVLKNLLAKQNQFKSQIKWSKKVLESNLISDKVIEDAGENIQIRRFQLYSQMINSSNMHVKPLQNGQFAFILQQIQKHFRKIRDNFVGSDFSLKLATQKLMD